MPGPACCCLAFPQTTPGLREAPAHLLCLPEPTLQTKNSQAALLRASKWTLQLMCELLNCRCTLAHLNGWKVSGVVPKIRVVRERTPGAHKVALEGEHAWWDSFLNKCDPCSPEDPQGAPASLPMTYSGRGQEAGQRKGRGLRSRDRPGPLSWAVHSGLSLLPRRAPGYSE